jgi:hypothetical protein
VIRWSALLTLAVAGAGCGAETWTFEEDAAVDDLSMGSDGATAPVDAGPSSGLDATMAPSDANAEAADADDGRGAARRDSGTDDNLGACHTEDECARLGLHCLLGDASIGTCVSCLTKADCANTYGRPVCDPTLNRCVECDKSSDCRQSEVCIGDPTHTCIPSCSGTLSCPLRASLCEPTSVCVECRTNAECQLQYVCDTVSGRCSECASNSDCRRSAPNCDPTTQRCVECLRNSDCGKGACTTFGSCIGSTVPRGDE